MEGSEELKHLKLAIELVPKTSWYRNLRNKMSSSNWNFIREHTYASYGNKCGICDAKNIRLECHEVWEYDDENQIQTLKGFIALCQMCHHVKHIGLAGILADEGKLDYDAVIEHFIRVNGCDKKGFLEHREKAFEIWEKRSKYNWTIDLGQFRNLIEGEK